MLVTERPGRLRVIALDGSMSKALEGLPEIFAQGQGGLLDVAASPDFAEPGRVYVSYAEPGDGGASTAVARGRLGAGRLGAVEVGFRQLPTVGWVKNSGSSPRFET